MRGPQRWVTSAFDVLARRRAARAVHPRGVLLDACVTLTDRESATAAALGGTGERPAVVRVSKSAGTPRGMPDLLGIAVRARLGDGQVLDVLFARVGRHRITRLLLVPSTGWCRGPYTTVLPYVVDGRTVMLGLEPEEPGRADGAEPTAVRDAVAQGPLRFTLTEGIGRRRRPVGTLVLASVRRGDDRADAPVSFDPVLNAHPRMHPARALSGLREWAYTGSRRGRGAEPNSLRRLP